MSGRLRRRRFRRALSRSVVYAAVTAGSFQTPVTWASRLLGDRLTFAFRVWVVDRYRHRSTLNFRPDVDSILFSVLPAYNRHRRTIVSYLLLCSNSNFVSFFFFLYLYLERWSRTVGFPHLRNIMKSCSVPNAINKLPWFCFSSC